MWNPIQLRHLGRSKRSRRSKERVKSLRRLRAHERLENRLLLAGDEGPLSGIMSVRFEFVNQSQNPVTELFIGEDYTLNVHIRDNRGSNATSVRQAYFDIAYNDVIDVTGSVNHDPEYATSVAGNTSTPGLIDEAGGVDTDRFPHLNPLDSEALLFSVPIHAVSAGTVQLTGDLADESFRSVLLFDSALSVDLANIDFLCDTIEVVDARVQISRTTGLGTSEAGSADTFEIVLSARPAADVNISLASSNTDEGTVSSSVVTFTTDNWNIPQTVTVTGVDDPRDDGDVDYMITTLATSADLRYHNLDVDDVAVTNTDDDTSSIEVSPISTNTREDGTVAMFLVRLTSLPSAPVTIPLSSTDTGEGTVPVNVQLDGTNYTGVMVPVTGVADNMIDGDVTFTIVTGDPVSLDNNYNALIGSDVANVSVTNEDLDTAGVNVSLISGNTKEDGTPASFTVTLTSQPSAAVTIPLSSSNESEGSVQSEVVLDDSNWQTGVTVEVTGEDDDVVDGDVTYTIETGDPASSDSNYSVLAASEIADISVINEDLDSAGVIVSAITGNTKEDGTTATFTVTLNSQPLEPVTIPLSSGDEGEGSVPSEIVLDDSNWQSGVTVEVTGEDDEVIDGDVTYTIETGDPVSLDDNYDALNASDVADVSVINEDLDSAGVIVSAISGNTREDGTTATFTVTLSSRPLEPVTIPLSSSDAGEGSVQSEVVLDDSNWQTGVTVEVTGEDDEVVDGDVTYTIETGDPVSLDNDYDALNASDVTDVSVINEDLDSAGVIVSAISGNTREDGTAATFTITLTSQPTEPVIIPLSSSNPAEGAVPESVELDAGNWQTGVTVEVTGVDDDVIDNDVSYTILTGDPTSVDAAYGDLGAADVADVSVVNEDLDRAGVTVMPIALTTNEGQTSSFFTVALDSQPAAPVTIPLSSTNTAEGTVQSSVVLDASNWTGVTVEVTGVNDDVIDNDVDYAIETGDPVSGDADYDVLTATDVADIAVISQNRHSAGVTFVPNSLTTKEDGTTATFTVTLTSRPTGPVTIPISSSDESEGMLTVSEVVLDAENWNTGVVVEVTGQDDGIVDGNVNYQIVTGDLSSSDSNYGGLTAADVPDVSMTNSDNESTISVTGISGNTSESGGTATFVVSLALEPTSPVTIPLRSTNENEGTVQAAAVLDSTNWDTGVVITVTGVDDAMVDGAAIYAIETLPASSGDPNFSNVDAADVTVVNDDNDSAALSITNFSQSEGSGSGTSIFTFDVMLSDSVANPFTVDFVTVDGTATAADGDYLPASQTLNFAGTQNELRTIAVAVNQDVVVEGDENFQIRLQNVVGAGAGGITLPAVNAIGTITNDDTAALTIISPTPTQEGTSPDDTAVDFVVQLSAPVQNGFTLAYSTNDGSASFADGDYADNDAELTFVGTAGETQNITVLIRADDRIEDDETLNVTLGVLSELVGIAVDDITVATEPAPVTILNDDFPELRFADVTANRAEGTGGTATEFTFEVTLTGNVADVDGFEIPFSVIDGTATADSGDYEVNVDSLQFTGMAGETQTITVSVNQDAIVESHETFSVRLGDVVGLDPGQIVGIPVDTLESTIMNDDTANLTLEAGSATGTEGEVYEFTVTLSAEVQGAFSIDYATVAGTATDADGDYVLANGTLTFTGALNESHSFSVQSQQDDKVELDEMFAVALQSLTGLPASAASSIFTVGDPISVTILNDDSATISITPPAAQNEGSGGSTAELVFEVSLSAPVQGGVTVDYQTVAGTAAAGSDFLAGGETLSFAGDAETKSVRVLVNADNVVEADETFQVVLDQLAVQLAGLEDSVTIETASATATLLNDDGATLSISGPGALDEGSDFIFTVTLSNAVQDGLVVGYTTEEGTATLSDNDFQDNDGSLTFAGIAGESHTITVQVTADDKVEPDETFSVLLGAIAGIPATAADDVLVAIGTSNATIRTNDFSRLLLSDVTASTTEGSTANGTTEFQFTVTLSDAVNDPDGFQVPLTINDGTASVAAGDYQDNDLVLSFNGTAMETQTVTVLVNQDSIVEADETFSVELGEIIGLEGGESILLDTTSLTATIQDDDTATLTLSAVEPSRAEGDSGTTEFVFDVSLSAPVQGGFEVPFTTGDLTATVAGGDYVDNDTILSFAGTSAETLQVTVLVNADEIVEGDEVFLAALGGINGLDAALLERVALSGLPVSATIINDDTATLSISGPAALSEGTGSDPTEFAFTVTLSAAVQGGLSVTYNTEDGTATLADDDFQDNDGVLMFAGTVPGTRTVIVVPVEADDKVEPDETFFVTLGEIGNLPSTAADDVTIAVGTATATILSDDFARLVFSDVTASTTEGSTPDGTTEFQFSVTLTDAVNDPDGFQIPLTINDGTATAASGDYQDSDVVLQFDGTAMETQIVTVFVNHDLVVEGDETFSAELGGIIGLTSGETVLVETSSLTATISDDDLATLTLSAPAASRNEGDSGTTDFVFEVTLSAPVQGSLEVPFKTNDLTATVADGDYIDQNATLNFSGASAETIPITVRVNGDTTVERDEMFEVALGAITGLDAALLERISIDGSAATMTIANDDTATLTIVGPGSLSEGNGAGATSFNYDVVLSNPIASSFGLSFQTSDGTASVAGNDYIDNDGSLTFSGDAETQTISVLVNRDLSVEGDESFEVALGSITGLDAALAGLLTVDTNPVAATILNDDAAAVSFVTDSNSLLEVDGQISIPVRLDIPGGGTLSAPAIVNVLTRDGSTASASDFTLATPTITFPTGSPNGALQNVRLTLIQDNLTEDVETIELGLELDGSNLTNVGLGSQTVHTVSVTDDAMDAAISGRVWVDANSDGALNLGEITLRSVMIELSGTTLSGETINAQTATDDDGFYQFVGLPAGTYSVSQYQPVEFMDGEDILGTVGGVPNGIMTNDRFDQIQIEPSQIARDYHFGECGLQSMQVNRFRILSRPRGTHLFGNPIASLTELPQSVVGPNDNAVPTLQVNIADALINENDGLAATTATVARIDGELDNALDVTLISNDASEATVPATVTIPVNQPSATFDIAAVDDQLADGTRTVIVSASATGYVDGNATVEVTDDEVPTLLVTIQDSSIGEDDGPAATTASVARNDQDLSSPLDVTLVSDDVSEVTVPITVTIPANQSAAFVDVSAVDDELDDGSQTVRVRASADGYVDGTDTVDVIDDEVPALTVTILDDSINEADGSAATTASVVRNDQNLSGALSVTLASADPTEVTVPPTVTIPANQLSATFNVDAVNDEIIDGTQTVTVTASAPGYIAGTDTVDVADDETETNLELDTATQLVTVNDPTPTLSVTWDQAVQQAVVNTSPGPTIGSRAFAMVHTAMFDAWSAYDQTAMSTVLADDLQRPASENTDANKTEAMSFAAFRVVDDLFASESEFLSDLMSDLGYDPANETTDTSTPAGIGNVMAAALLESRHADGSNQLGDSPDGVAGVPYSNVAAYDPVNEAGSTTDIEHWSPEFVPIDSTPGSEERIQSFLTPHWGEVTPFSLDSGDQFRPQEPEPFLLVDGTADLAAGTITRADDSVVPIERDLIGTVINPGFIDQAEHVVDVSANLTDEQKLIAEFWEDGEGTSFPPGTWMTFGQFVSARDDHSLDQDAQMFLALSNAMLDAGIATWEAKSFYDYARPVRVIRELGGLELIGEFDENLDGYAIDAWTPGGGTQKILATDFLTYQTPGGDPSPPFAEYTSGHSAFSAAGAEILRLFSGSDDFGASVRFDPGESRFEPGVTPAEPVMLQWDTFSTAADEAGVSRLYGGIHFVDGDQNGRALGRQIGGEVWAKAQFYISGGMS